MTEHFRANAVIPAGYERDARGKLNTIQVEFLDGFTVFTSRYAVRRVPE